MQNNVTELTERLLRALDANYNVIDMPSVIEIISLLEGVAINKDLLEKTRLGRHINALRRNMTDGSLAKRAKELVRKWRDTVLAQDAINPPVEHNGQSVEPNGQTVDGSNGQLIVEPNGQLADSQNAVRKFAALQPNSRKTSPAVADPSRSRQHSGRTPPSMVETLSGRTPPSAVELSRSNKRTVDNSPQGTSYVPSKRPRLNGQTSEFDFSDNSNSSFRDVIGSSSAPATELNRDAIVVNSDSNSSLPADPQLDQQMPKKRGRKKGSKNYKNLIDEAETSFTNKMAVSRGNAKVKTTQELIASLQNKSNTLPPLKPIEDLNERAAKLTERVSIIDQKLNTNANRYKNAQRKRPNLSSDRVIESGSVINVKRDYVKTEDEDDDDDVVVIDDIEPVVVATDATTTTSGGNVKTEAVETKIPVVTSLSVEDALAKLPPINHDALFEDENDVPLCSCQLRENKTDEDLFPTYEIKEDQTCSARLYLEQRYHLGEDVTTDRVCKLHSEFIANVNGNVSLGSAVNNGEPLLRDDGLFVDVVPKVNSECLPKDPKPCENYKKYSISEERTMGDGKTFREWHEVVESTSYNGEILRILPYCIID